MSKDRDRDSGREGTGLQLSSRKKERRLWWLFNYISFIQINSRLQSRPWPWQAWETLGSFCCYREKAKYNCAASQFHCKQTSSAFFFSFRTLSSIHYNTHSILILREASTRGALEVPWLFTPNRAIRACGVLWKTQVPHQKEPSPTYLGNPHNCQFLSSQQWAHIGMCQPGYCVISQSHHFSLPKTDKEKQ